MGITGLQIACVVLGLIATVFGIIHIIKYRFKTFRQAHLQKIKKRGPVRDTDYCRRTYPQVDVFRHRTLFFQVGLLLSITLVYGLLQWTNGERQPDAGQDPEVHFEFIDLEDIPMTTHQRPPLPEVPAEWREIVPDPELKAEVGDEEIPPLEHDAKTEPGDSETGGDNGPFMPVTLPIIPLEEEPLWVVAEDMPRFPGCENQGSKKEKEACAQEKLLSFIYSHIQYPALASKNGIEGTAVVTFIIEKDGSVQSAKVLRDIGGGCGQEALRVIELMVVNELRWTPGKQQGKPVRVQFNLPVKFKLQ